MRGLRRIMDIVLFYCADNETYEFTYRDIRIYFFRMVKQRRMYRIDWHTVERGLRRLAEMGFLRRVKYRRTVKFVVMPPLIRYYGLPDIVYSDPLLLRKYVKS